MDDAQRDARGHRGVHRVAAGLQDGVARLGGEVVARHHHVARAGHLRRERHAGGYSA